MTDEDEDDTPKLPVPVAKNDPQHPSDSPAVPPLTNPTSTGILSRFRVDLDTLMLKSLRERQGEVTAFLTEYGRTADAARSTAEKVALLQDLDAIREAARADAADQREEAAHKRQVAALRRQEELANQQHRTNAAKYGERVFRETEPELADIRRQGLKAREQAAVRSIVDAEAHVLSAEALRNNSHAERVQSIRDLADIIATPAEEPEVQPTASPPCDVLKIIRACIAEQNTQGNKDGANALLLVEIRITTDAAASGSAITLARARQILDDEILKAVHRDERAALTALYSARVKLDAACQPDDTRSPGL